jgi:hypothetical protein
MKKMTDSNPITPWYKQFWPWFLISLPLSAVIGSMITINLAITDTDGLVKDDYYKEGLAVNADKARKQMAETLGIQAQCEIETNTGQVSITLNDAAIGDFEKFILKLIHPTRAHNDMTIPVEKTSANTFTGKLTLQVQPGYWWVRMAPENDSWYIEGRIKLPADKTLLLK